MRENPGAYNEARNRLRENQEKEKKIIEDLQEKFEKERSLTQAEKRFDIFELRRHIETGRSLFLLQKEIQEALRDGLISRETFDTLNEDIVFSEAKEKKLAGDDILVSGMPFSETELAKFFENKKLGDNFLIDIGGFFYGFFVQGSAILIIILWKILLDIIFLPRDIYNEIKK